MTFVRLSLVSTFFAVAITSSAAPAFACPHLEGRWHCSYSNSQPDQDILLTQAEIPNGVLYTLKTAGGNTYLFYVDSAARTKTDHQRFKYTTTYACIGDTGFSEVQTISTNVPDFSGDSTGLYSLADETTFNGQETTTYHIHGSPDLKGSVTYFSCRKK